MLSLHTQVENLVNLLHQRRSDAARRVDRVEAYRSLVAAILDVPVMNIREPVPQPVLQPVSISTSHRRAA